MSMCNKNDVVAWNLKAQDFAWEASVRANRGEIVFTLHVHPEHKPPIVVLSKQACEQLEHVLAAASMQAWKQTRDIGMAKLTAQAPDKKEGEA